jgi:hypothetical protein
MGVQRKRGCVALLLGFGLSLLPEVLNHVITSNANWVDLLFQWMGAPPNCPYSFTDSLGNNATATLAVAEAAGTVTLTWLMFPKLWGFALDRFSHFDDFKQACASSSLPRYSFLEPSFLGNPNDDHPPHDAKHGRPSDYR